MSTLSLPPSFLASVGLHDTGYAETGGWLLARREAPDKVVWASGPGPDATRTRDSIAVARIGVDEAAEAAGFAIVGCWHSHPPNPHGTEPSPEDREAWRAELRRSPRDLDKWHSVIVLRNKGRSEALAAWITRRDGSCTPVPLPPIDDRARRLAQSLAFGLRRGALVGPPAEWDPVLIRRELARLEVELEAEELVRRRDLNARLERLGMKPLQPVSKLPASKPKPEPTLRRQGRQGKDLDRELLEWMRNAPDGLDEKTYGKLLVVLVESRRGPSILDFHREHFAVAS